MKRSFCTLLACLSFTSFSAYATFPDRTITLVVPYSAGGGVDFVARVIANGLTKQLGETILVENRPGAGGTIGAAFVAHATPDGYTLLVGGTGPLAVGPLIYKNLTYSPTKDLITVSLVVLIPQILVVSPALPVKTVQELVAMARTKNGSMTVGTGGRGTSQELAATMLAELADIKLISVPYKGTSAALTDLLGGHIDMLFGDPSIMASIKAGQLHALAVTTPGRSPALPDVPTLAESGIKDYVMQSFYGLTAPAATPDDVIQTLNKAVGALLADPDTQKKFLVEGMIPTYDTPAQARAFIIDSTNHAAKLLEKSDSKAPD
jgi:tripartite-type tricarboxylate transporter receptor subunit TctC